MPHLCRGPRSGENRSPRLAGRAETRWAAIGGSMEARWHQRRSGTDPLEPSLPEGPTQGAAPSAPRHATLRRRSGARHHRGLGTAPATGGVEHEILLPSSEPRTRPGHFSLGGPADPPPVPANLTEYRLTSRHGTPHDAARSRNAPRRASAHHASNRCAAQHQTVRYGTIPYNYHTNQKHSRA